MDNWRGCCFLFWSQKTAIYFVYAVTAHIQAGQQNGILLSVGLWLRQHFSALSEQILQECQEDESPSILDLFLLSFFPFVPFVNEWFASAFGFSCVIVVPFLLGSGKTSPRLN